MDWIFIKLRHFSKKQRDAIMFSVGKNNLRHLDNKQVSNLRYLFATMVNEDMAANRGDHVTRMIKESAVYEKPLNLYRVAGGESFGIRIDKQYVDMDQDGNVDSEAVYNFNSYRVIARERDTDGVISEELEGNTSRIQVVRVPSLELGDPGFYAVDLVLIDEVGKDINILDTIYLLVEDKIVMSVGEEK